MEDARGSWKNCWLFYANFLKCLLREIYFLGDFCVGLGKTRGNLTVKMCIFSCETPEYSLGSTLFYSQGKFCTRSTSWSCQNQSLNLVIGRWTFVFPKFGITAKGSLACCVSLVPARRWCLFIHTHIHGLAMLDKDNWKLFVLFGIQTNSSPHTLHWKFWVWASIIRFAQPGQALRWGRATLVEDKEGFIKNNCVLQSCLDTNVGLRPFCWLVQVVSTNDNDFTQCHLEFVSYLVSERAGESI